MSQCHSAMVDYPSVVPGLLPTLVEAQKWNAWTPNAPVQLSNRGTTGTALSARCHDKREEQNLEADT